jgi:hypothetical protein
VHHQRRGGAVGGWDWGEMAGETGCIGMIGRATWLLQDTVARRTLITASWIVHHKVHARCHCETMHSLMAKRVVGLCTAVLLAIYCPPLWLLNSSPALDWSWLLCNWSISHIRMILLWLTYSCCLSSVSIGERPQVGAWILNFLLWVRDGLLFIWICRPSLLTWLQGCARE